MRVRFKPLGTLRRKIGKNEMVLDLNEGATVGDALDAVLENSEEEVRHIVMTEGELSGNLILMLNKTSVENLEGEDTKLHDGDEIVLLPHIQGGEGDCNWT
jgi:molybdopterin synthase sulfur carrier subunit